MNSPVRSAPRRIAVLLFNGVRLLDVTGPLEVFDVARALRCDYEVTLYSVEDQHSVHCSSGVVLGTLPVHSMTGTYDTVLVPGGERLVAEPIPPALISVLQAQSTRTRRTASICAGSFALAAAGLLENKRATTHWRHLDTLAARHPQVDVERTSVYVQDGSMWSSAGVAAGIDLALALVADDYGSATAHEISKDMVVFSRRVDGHPQLSVAARTPRPQHPHLERLIDDINVNPAGRYTLESAAAQVGVSPRHLARLFTKQVGCSLRDYVHQVRIEAAIGLVLTGESFHAAAQRSGLRDGADVRDFLRTRYPDQSGPGSAGLRRD
jgi:transcriptional regulator GlxA family with amidase domain